MECEVAAFLIQSTLKLNQCYVISRRKQFQFLLKKYVQKRLKRLFFETVLKWDLLNIFLVAKFSLPIFSFLLLSVIFVSLSHIHTIAMMSQQGFKKRKKTNLQLKLIKN